MRVTVYYNDGLVEEFTDVKQIENDRPGYDPIIRYVNYNNGAYEKAIIKNVAKIIISL